MISLTDGPSEDMCSVERIGVAKLTKMAFDGCDLTPLWCRLIDEIARDPSNTGAAMDMAVIAQLAGDQKTGLALQSRALDITRLYRTPCAAAKPRLRVLVLSADTDIGSNTPIEFLLEDSDIEILTLYVMPGKPLPDPLPAHDVAFVAASNVNATHNVLAEISRLIGDWPHPPVNLPERIAALDRDRLHRLLGSVPGLCIPATARISRAALLAVGSGQQPIGQYLDGGDFPLIARPVESHAGRGLVQWRAPEEIVEYLDQRQEDEFFISRYVDYRSPDGLFRKYRVVLVDGRPYPCHMAISDQWKIWYLNAEMAQSESKRAEEEHFMTTFDDGFASLHHDALEEMAHRIGLEYFAIDCAETKTGELLLFEGDNAMIVHNMDPAGIYPYKPAQMLKIFDAFSDMLYKYSRHSLACAA